MSLVVHKLVLSPGGATATTAQPPTAHHVTLSAYTHARSNATDSMGRVLDGPPSGSMSTPPSSSSPYSSSSSNSSSSSKHSSTYNLPFVLQDHNYGAPPPPTPPHSPPPLPSTSSSSSSSSSQALSHTSSSSGSTYQHHHHFQQHHHQQQQQHQYHHHHHQTYQSATMAPSSSASPSTPSSSLTSHHHTSSSTSTLHHHQHHHHHHPVTTSTATVTAPHHHHPHHQHHHPHSTNTANHHHHHHHHHHHQQQQQHHQHQHQHHSSTTTPTTPHLPQKHHNFLPHPGPSPRLGSSSSTSSTTPSSTTTSSSTSNTPSSSSTSFSSPSLSVGGVMAHHPLTNMPPHRQQFMPHPKSSIIFPSPHIPPPPIELSPHHSHHHQSPPSSTTGPQQPVLTSTETDDDSRLSDRSSSVGPSGEETETAPEGEGDDLPADDSITRCVCDFSHDDGYMIQCDRCFVWQHVDCMEIDRDNIPDEYLCEACDPRPIDRFKARALQIRRRQEIKAHLARLSSSDSEDNIPMSTKSRGSLNKVQERKVVKKKKVKQIKDMKNGRKGGSGGSGSLSLLKKSGGGSNTTTTTSCNNSILPSQEDKDRRMLVKRRRKSNSLSGGEGVSDDSSGGPVERLRAWVEGYEAAVTNHYSPELRARVHAARINGVSPDLRASTQGAVLGHRCRVANNPRPLLDVFDSKILVAATRLSPNTAITEFQGKYLLASQWNAQQPVSSQPYMPYVLQYHMPKEGLTVCVDARTYGNDARFTRHSCTPNAEVRHVVERGSLHLYIVATQEIEEGEEVTLALENANSTLELVCCLAEEHDCQAPPGAHLEQTTPAPTPTHKKNGLIVGNKKALKKQQLQLQLRTSKRTASSETRLMESVTTTPVNPSTPVTTVKQRRASGCGKSPVKSPSTASLSSSPEEVSKDVSSSNPSSNALPTATGTVTSASDTPRTTLDKQQQQKMTREERKIAAYMKAFERMEKAAQRRQEMEKKKEEDKCKEVREPKEKEKKRCDGDEEDWEKTSSADECVRSMGGTERCRRKGKKGRGKGSPQKRSNHRADSAASDLTGDESSCASVGLMSPSGGATVESIALNFNSPPQGNPNAMGFRFPKTKKALMNEWLNENVDPVVPVGSVVGTDLPSGVPPCYMRSPAMPLRRSSLNQTTGTGVMPVQDMPGGSAKKRWLRQAISEETETPHFNGLCPSPNSRPDSPTGGGDYITPLKKRRLARESMSSELSSTPPSTPVHSTSLEEDKMVEEMEAELAEEDAQKTNSSSRYSREHQPTSPSIQDDTTCIGFLRSAADNNSNSGRMKRVVVQQDEEEEEEEEDLVIDEGGSFFDQGSGAVNFSKVAACGRLSQGQTEEPCKKEEDKGRGVTRGKNRRGKKVCYEPQEEEEDGDEKEEGKEVKEKEGSESEESEDHEEKEKQNKIDSSRREPAKAKRRQSAVKKGIRCQQQQVAKRGKKQQGGSAKKGKQEVKAKAEPKRRKPVRRGKGEITVTKVEEVSAEEDEETEKEEKDEEEKPTIKEEDEKPEIIEDLLQRVKEEPGQPEIKTEAGETTTETDCKVEPKDERQEEQESVKVETAVKKEEEAGVEEEEEKKTPEVKAEPDTPVSERLDKATSHQDEESTLENKLETSDNPKEIEDLDSTGDAKPDDKMSRTDQDKPQQEEVKSEREDNLRPASDKPETTVVQQSSDDNQEQLHPTTATPEASASSASKVEEPANRKVITEEENVTSDEEEETKTPIKKKAERVNRKVRRPRRQAKKSKEPKHKQKGVKESSVIPHEKEDTSVEESNMQKVETELEKETDAKEPEQERKDIEEQDVSKECSKSPSAQSNKKSMDEENDIQEPVCGKAAQCDARERPQTPVKEDVDKTPLQAKSDGSPVITLEARVKLDAPLKTEEHLMEVSRKPPTPPTLFPPLPWQTNPETFAESDPLRPKTPENSSFLGVRGPRTPEGPAPTSPSDPTMSPPSCSPRSPPTSVGDSEIKGEEKRLRENTTEGNWRSRARGPCTPPTPPPQEATQEEEQQQQQEGGEESSSSPSHQHPPSNPESTQTRPAPVKKKLSILEYRKRKSVGGEAGPLDSSPPPCQPPNFTSGGDSSGSTRESLMRQGTHSPSQSSPHGLTGGSGEDGDSSPDLPLSPICPIILPPSPINFDTRSTAEETKREGENYRLNATGTGGNSDISRHSLVNKIMSSNNSSSNNSSNTPIGSSSSNVSSSCAVTESSTTLNATTTSATTITATHTHHPISGGNTQDVKWNAAPTLLERQRENLTARLRREFGLCVSDDDEDKSSVRLGCSGVLSRPPPPLVPPTTPLSTALSSLSPRARKPPSLTAAPPCAPYVAEGDERGHRRHKNLPQPPLPPPPPPPPPPTTAPKNSIFQGREVTVQKVAGTVVKASVVGTGQPAGGITGGGSVGSGTQRLLGSSGLFPAPTPTPPSPLIPPGVRGGSSSQGTAPASPGIPNVLPGAVPRPCPVPPPIGVPPVPAPPVVQAGLAVLPAVAHGLPGLPPSKQPGHCITPALTASQQNPEYPGRHFSRGQFSAPAMASLTSPLSLYTAARLGPPPPPPLPPQTDPVGPGLRGPSPPGHADPARVGGESGTSYSGQDCPAPGTRGS